MTKRPTVLAQLWLSSLMILPLLLLLLPTDGFAAEGADGCVPKGNARPICIFRNPEDIVALPGNQALVIGEYGQTAEDHSGELALFILETEERRTLFRGGEVAAVAREGWGDPACKTAPTSAFNAHGIDLVRRDDGRVALLVVQHGSREAVEFFELLGEGSDWHAAWRGCVEAPPDASLNEVAALPDGGFYTTKMTSRSGGIDFEKGMPTEPTGHAFGWSPASGYRKIGGTEASIPNGLTVSPDGRHLYMNASGNNTIRKVEIATGKVVGEAPVRSPDNVTWSPDGRRLLVASLGGLSPADFEICQNLEKGQPCRIPFAIVAIDPVTMTNRGPIYESDGWPMGGGTVGLQVGSELFVGSFAGDRILRISLE